MTTDISSYSKYLDSITETFGGYEVARTLVGKKTLSKILLFPGFIYVIRPWSPQANLVSHGYTIGTNYRVFDSNGENLYERRSNSGLFGDTINEQLLISSAKHGDYWTISFDTESGPTIGLLWIATKVNPIQIKNTVKSWERQNKVLSSALNQHEAFIRTDQLNSGDVVKVWFLSGQWSQHLSEGNIKSNPFTRVSFIPADGVISLYPRQSGWYVFEVVSGNYIYSLDLSDIKGPATNRIRQSTTGAYFFELRPSSGIPKKLDSSFLPSLAKSSNRNLDVEFIHLEASFSIRAKYYLEGRSYVECDASVIRHGFPNILSGQSLAYANHSPSFNAGTDASENSADLVYEDNVSWDDTKPWEESVNASYFAEEGSIVIYPYPGEEVSIDAQGYVLSQGSAEVIASSEAEAEGVVDN